VVLVADEVIQMMNRRRLIAATNVMLAAARIAGVAAAGEMYRIGFLGIPSAALYATRGPPRRSISQSRGRYCCERTT